MNIYSALSLFSLIILIYWVITELFTILFRFTGLPDERARFQVISLLTGCGFTTKESEMILSNKRRRRLARITMLFGYVFNITIVSAFINVFLSLKVAQVGSFFAGILIPIAALVMLMEANGDDRCLQRFVDRYFVREETFNSVLLLDYFGSDSIAQITLKHIPEEYRGLSLAETGLRANTGILVMLVEHPSKKAEAARADTIFEVGDTLTVFGNYTTICKAFHARERFAD